MKGKCDICLYFLLPLLIGVTGARAQEINATTNLNGQMELARLVDLCAQRLKLNVDYDAAALKGTVSLRVDHHLRDDEMWMLTNRVLATRGFTSVQLPGASPQTFSIVKLADAPAMAAVNVSSETTVSGESGFVSLVTRVQNQSVKAAIDALKQVLSKPGGAVSDIGIGNLVLISDLRTRVDEAVRLLEMIDVPGPTPVIRRIPAKFVSGTQLASAIMTASAASDALSNIPRKGKVLSTLDPDSLVLICPPSEEQSWLNLIQQFDQRQAVETRAYSSRSFSPAELSKLIEQTAKQSPPRGSGDQWRLVTDDLTGTLIVTATAAEHQSIEQLMRRLDAVPSATKRPMRVFVIRNRSVREISDVLSKLLETGILDMNESVDTNLPGVGEQRSSDSVDVAGSVTTRPTLPESATSLITPHPESAQPQVIAPKTKQLAGVSYRGSAFGEPHLSQRAVNFTADEGTNTIIATADSRVLNQLAEIIRKLDVRQPQVMIEVLIASLSDTQTLDLGVELRKLEISGATTISLSSLFGLGTPGSGPPGTGAIGAGKGFTGVVLSPGDFSVVLRALQTINRGRVLSLPKVLVNNNQQATLNSVLQQPFVSVNASDTIATTSFGGTDNAGTIITIKPQIAEGDHLVLQYSVSLSSFVGDSIDPTVPPPKQSNNLSSLVTIPDGYTVVVGGLEITNDSTGLSQVPLLGSIPIIGEAFKNRSNTRSRTRFYVFIRSDVMRHEGFDELKYLSDQSLREAGLNDQFRDWPEVQPRIIQ